jgi:hypothetical protein
LCSVYYTSAILGLLDGYFLELQGMSCFGRQAEFVFHCLLLWQTWCYNHKENEISFDKLYSLNINISLVKCYARLWKYPYAMDRYIDWIVFLHHIFCVESTYVYDIYWITDDKKVKRDIVSTLHGIAVYKVIIKFAVKTTIWLTYPPGTPLVILSLISQRVRYQVSRNSNLQRKPDSAEGNIL